MSDGNMDQVRKMIDRLSSQNTERGQALLAQIERYEKKTPVTAERLAEIQAEIELIPESRARADSLLTVASQLGAIDQKASLKFLDRARERSEEHTSELQSQSKLV